MLFVVDNLDKSLKYWKYKFPFPLWKYLYGDMVKNLHPSWGLSVVAYSYLACSIAMRAYCSLLPKNGQVKAVVTRVKLFERLVPR